MDKGGKQEFIIRVGCVIAAFILWLFITSTENPVNDYRLRNIPVQLVNTDILADSDLILSPGQDLSIDLSIKGANTSILLDKSPEDFTVVADLSAYALKEGEQKIPIEIKRSPDNINVVNSDSLFIKVKLEKLIENKLPINLNVSGKPKQGFYASEPKLSQEYATVVGGSNSVNTVKQIIIEENIQDTQSDVTKTYKLKPVDSAGKEVEGVVVKPSHIDVNIPIRKTKAVAVKVQTVGKLNPNFTLESIKVTPERFDLIGSEAELNGIESLNTESIDLSKITESTTVDSKVLIPDGLSLDSTTSDTKVKVEINLKNVEVNTEKVIKKDLSLNIKYINLDPNYEVKLAKDKTELVVSGNETVMNALNTSEFDATVDLVDLVEGEHTVTVPVPMPQGIKLISQSPDEILVTITKKQAEVTDNNDNTGE